MSSRQGAQRAHTRSLRFIPQLDSTHRMLCRSSTSCSSFTVRLPNGDTRELEFSLRTSDVAPLFSEVWLGTEVWPAAMTLINILEASPWPQRLARARHVVELGAGTGACGLAAAALGAPSVTVTDMPSLLEQIEHNVQANSLEHLVRTEALTWARELPAGSCSSGADIVLMSDCLNAIYGEQHAQCLAATLHALLRRAVERDGSTHEEQMALTAGSIHEEQHTPIGLLSQTRRGEGAAEAQFFAACSALGMKHTLLYTAPGSALVEVFSIRL